VHFWFIPPVYNIGRALKSAAASEAVKQCLATALPTPKKWLQKIIQTVKMLWLRLSFAGWYGEHENACLLYVFPRDVVDSHLRRVSMGLKERLLNKPNDGLNNAGPRHTRSAVAKNSLVHRRIGLYVRNHRYKQPNTGDFGKYWRYNLQIYLCYFRFKKASYSIKKWRKRMETNITYALTLVSRRRLRKTRRALPSPQRGMRFPKFEKDMVYGTG
jgi:hypothetical protein